MEHLRHGYPLECPDYRGVHITGTFGMLQSDWLTAVVHAVQSVSQLADSILRSQLILRRLQTVVDGAS